MSRSTYTLFMGVFSAALNLIMMIFTFLFIAGVQSGILDDSSEEVTEATDAENESFELVADKTEISMLVLFLLADFIFGFIISMFMVVGVKKERHQYIAPWVYFSLIGIILQVFVIFKEFGDDDDEESSPKHLFAVIFTTVFMSAIWWPVYSYYKSLKNVKCADVEAVEAYHCGSAPAAFECPTPAYNYTEFSHASAKHVPQQAASSHAVYPSVK